MKRRQFLQHATTAAAVSLLGACSGDGPVVQIDNTLPVGPFGAESTAEEVTLGMDLKGRVAMVTGCNSGLGYETMRVLALRGAHVIGTGRTLEKASKACASVSGSTTPVVLELSSLESAVDCARTVGEMGLSPDILICNAGINTFGELETGERNREDFPGEFSRPLCTGQSVVATPEAGPSSTNCSCGKYGRLQRCAGSWY